MHQQLFPLYAVALLTVYVPFKWAEEDRDRYLNLHGRRTAPQIVSCTRTVLVTANAFVKRTICVRTGYHGDERSPV